MSLSLNRRQFIDISLRAVASTSAARFFVRDNWAETTRSPYILSFSPLDAFIERYMREMNSPGMTLVLADRSGIQRVATYGFNDPETRVEIQSKQLFEIGSISKSFVANCLLQLRQEGKVDFNKPIVEYLPWFQIDSPFQPITVHHMLTHSSGLPADAPVFLSDSSARHHPAYPPGQHFHYCNTAYVVLGHLLWTLDGQPLPEVFRQRILRPLGMSRTEPVISLDIRGELAKNYVVFQNDRPYPRNGRLSEAPAVIITDGSGCIASTPHDMGLYIQMITNKGNSSNGELLSAESFTLFSKAHIKAEEFGPTANYGYGVFVDTLDGHSILRHTGGMVSFASALQVDIDEGVGAFASINAMQGYRPTPVAQYAIQLMRAQRESKSVPSAPSPNPPTAVKNAADYVGAYKSPEGREFEIFSAEDKLALRNGSERIPLEHSNGDVFTVPRPSFERFALVFGRENAKDAKSPVVEAGWGAEWFTNGKYTGPKQFEYPRDWNTYIGHYRNENPWIGSIRIVLRKGKLLIDGIVPLEAAEDGTFWLRDKEYSPEWIRFDHVVNSQAMHLKFSGEDLWRVITK
jgi:D-alanyl-D-alanine carboxypeptidase